MSKQALITISVIVLAIIVGAVLLTTGERSTNQNNNQVGGAATSSENGFVPNIINAAHQYNDETGVHIIAGETEVPTPCHALSHDVTIAESMPEQVSLNLSSSVEDPDQMCAQEISSQRFKATFEASEDARISATYNGQDVRLNLQEVGPDEDLEDFEVYTKG